MRKTSGCAMAAAVATVFAILVPSAGAHAEIVDPPVVTTRIQHEMHLVGFDAAVAAAHGYKIVTAADGSQSSVPTASEQNGNGRKEKDGTAARTQIDGPCGVSWINIESHGRRKVVTTGYTVPKPVILKLWITQIFGWGGLVANTWSLGSGPSWDGEWSLFYDTGGFVNVTPGSNVVMEDGTVCASGSPGENF